MTFAVSVAARFFHQKLLCTTLKVFNVGEEQNKRKPFVSQENGLHGKPLGSEYPQPLRSERLFPGYPSKRFSDFFNAYGKATNKACGRTGSSFQHPFGRNPVSTGRQFWNVIAYIHQNPQKHKFVEDFREWKWSSYGIILNERPTKLERDTVLEWFGGRQQYLSHHAEWAVEANSKWFAGDDPD